jgi:hypothetical protein
VGFDYPSELIRVVEFGLTNLEPWWIFDADPLRDRAVGLGERYPARRLVPFARRKTTTMWPAGISTRETSR